MGLQTRTEYGEGKGNRDNEKKEIRSSFLEQGKEGELIIIESKAALMRNQFTRNFKNKERRKLKALCFSKEKRGGREEKGAANSRRRVARLRRS